MYNWIGLHCIPGNRAKIEWDLQEDRENMPKWKQVVTTVPLKEKLRQKTPPKQGSRLPSTSDGRSGIDSKPRKRVFMSTIGNDSMSQDARRQLVSRPAKETPMGSSLQSLSKPKKKMFSTHVPPPLNSSDEDNDPFFSTSVSAKSSSTVNFVNIPQSESVGNTSRNEKALQGSPAGSADDGMASLEEYLKNVEKTSFEALFPQQATTSGSANKFSETTAPGYGPTQGQLDEQQSSTDSD